MEDDVMGVPSEAPAEVHAHWDGVPNCAEISFLFQPFGFGLTIRVRCEGWGQLASDSAATMQAIYHIKNRKRLWWARYAGWEEIGGDRRGVVPVDFYEQYDRHWKSLGR